MEINREIAYPEGQSWMHKYASFSKIGREWARELGQRVYWSGIECKKGHLFWRYTSSDKCAWCTRDWNIRATSNALNTGSRMLDIDKLREDMALRRELEGIDL